MLNIHVNKPSCHQILPNLPQNIPKAEKLKLFLDKYCEQWTIRQDQDNDIVFEH